MRPGTLAAALCALLSAQPVFAAEPAGAVRGSVSVLQATLFGGRKPARDRGGVLVYLTGFTRAAKRPRAALEQHDKRFVPRVLPIVVGQEVTFPNRDRIYHNVFSVSPVHPFDLGQYQSEDPPKTEVFAQPGLVPVYCNIHPEMISYVVVLENDAFAVTARDGSFAIESAPPGRWTLNAWLPGSRRESREVEIRAGETVRAELELRDPEKVLPHRRKDGTPYPPPDDVRYD
jgi:plastocyanin